MKLAAGIAEGAPQALSKTKDLLRQELEIRRHELAEKIFTDAAPLAARAGLAVESSRIHYLRGCLHFVAADVAACRDDHEAALEWALRAERAGADGILTYFALDAARYLRG